MRDHLQQPVFKPFRAFAHAWLAQAAIFYIANPCPRESTA
ncbi:hypothetical protein [Polaromonas sp. CG9_12]|nr:hypothetical protein [Polaromonas sp. CG9_12]